MAAAARLGYQTNLAARALASQRSGLIAIVVASVADPMLASVACGAQRTLAECGYDALLICLDAAVDSRRTEKRSLTARGVEGIVYLGVAPGASEAEGRANDGARWVVVTEGEFTDGRRFDDGRRRGAELACRFLLDLGHERFGVVSQREGGTREGVTRVLEGTGASLVVGEWPGGDSTGVRAAVNRLLDARPAPSAIICSSDEEALAAVRECRVRGIAVPGEVSIVGFGDATFARYALPALTTVRVPAAEIGRRSAEALLQAISGTEPEPYEPSVKLAIRETSGPPPP
jgi:LacI family transcriptional regulator